jgi:hypothetical protein
MRGFAIDLDGADEDKAPHTGCCGLARQVQGPLDIDTTEFSQGVSGCVIHHMRPGCGVHDDGDARQSMAPVGIGGQITHLHSVDAIGHGRVVATNASARFSSFTGQSGHQS